MAVYTYFDGMTGLWSAVRQEAFVRLRERLTTVRPARDPVRHLATLGVVYVENALANRDLYRIMFESDVDLHDPQVAASTFEPLVLGVRAAQRARRFDADLDAGDVAVRYWAGGHGLTSLVVAGVLSPEDLRRHAPATAVATFTAAGDGRDRAEDSVAAAWRDSRIGLSRTGP
jgi:hypothetical protein